MIDWKNCNQMMMTHFPNNKEWLVKSHKHPFNLVQYVQINVVPVHSSLTSSCIAMVGKKIGFYLHPNYCDIIVY